MRTGDIIFIQIGDSSNAISAVTEGYKGARINHVGVLIETDLGIFVLEAFPPEVRLTNLKVFVNRSKDSYNNPRYMLGRLKEEYHSLISDAVSYGLKQRNVPYDRRYLSDEAFLYCSELIVDMFKYANGGDTFFIEKPMNFSDLETGEILEYWIKYYEYFGMDVPVGYPGSNPGDLSKDEKIIIYNVVGEITGYER